MDASNSSVLPAQTRRLVVIVPPFVHHDNPSSGTCVRLEKLHGCKSQREFRQDVGGKRSGKDDWMDSDPPIPGGSWCVITTLLSNEIADSFNGFRLRTPYSSGLKRISGLL